MKQEQTGQQVGRVISVNISEKTGTIKVPVERIDVGGGGIDGDAHSGNWHRQVSLLPMESINRFSAQHDYAVKPGEFAENITTGGIDLTKVSVLDRFLVGEAQLEVTQIGKHCHGDRCAIFREVGACVMPREGIFCRVLSGGEISPQSELVHVYRPLRVLVLTVSDRAHSGEYNDGSGPRALELLREYFENTRWHTRFENALVPDEPVRIRETLEAARDNRTDVVICTGGTGIGPRDVTPEIVVDLTEKQIPGIMEHIRATYGADKPNALLSRSVAGITQETLVYALPGSVRAVTEYLNEILKTMEHAILMLHRIDAH